MKENMKINTDIKINKFLESYKKVQTKLEGLFVNIAKGEKIVINNLDDEIEQIIKMITKNNNILSLLRKLDKSGKYLIDHSVNVGLIAATIGKSIGYSEERLKDLLMAGLLHDIGMLKVPRDIIDKPGPLSEEEFIIIINHTINGHNMLKRVSGINSDITYGALTHHEREDGSGYPFGIKSNEIHEFGKIIAIADVFDAMTTDKIYKKKKTPFMATEEMLYNSFEVLDGEITTAFLNNASKHYIGSKVKLNDGSIGEVVEINKAIPTKPVIGIEGKLIDLLENNDYEIIDIID